MIKDKILEELAEVLLKGAGEGSVSLCIKLLAYSVCVTRGLPIDSKELVERELEKFIEEKVKELKEEKND